MGKRISICVIIICLFGLLMVFSSSYYKGDIDRRSNGSMIAMESGTAFAYAIDKLQDRGKFFIFPQDEVYAGQVVGEHVHDNDLVINVTKSKSSALMDGGEKIQVRSFAGNFLVVVKALTYVMTLGKEGVPEAAQNAVLNANYLQHLLKGTFTPAFDRICMHEFVLCLEHFKKETGVSALDVAKSLIDHGIHPPTMYFPLIVHEALMLEPTETESRETLEQAAEVLRELYAQAYTDPQTMHEAPHHAQIGRPDEVRAARNPIVRWKKA